jgi:hypothetical protein
MSAKWMIAAGVWYIVSLISDEIGVEIFATFAALFFLWLGFTED